MTHRNKKETSSTRQMREQDASTETPDKNVKFSEICPSCLLSLV